MLPDIHGLLLEALSLERSGRFSSALEKLRIAASVKPNDPDIRYHLARLFVKNDMRELAQVQYASCLSLDPSYQAAMIEYAELLRLNEHFSLAFNWFERADPKLSSHWLGHQKAVCCAHMEGMEAHADDLFRTQLRQHDDPLTAWEYAQFLLRCGRWEEAWIYHARRFEAGASIGLSRLPFDYPAWDGVNHPGDCLLVMGEQGAGDEILFARFLQFLPDTIQGMSNLVVVRSGLICLFGSSFPKLNFCTQEEAVIKCRKWAEHSPVWQVALGDLPRFLPIPACGRYLAVNSGQAVHRANDVLRVGLVLNSRRVVAGVMKSQKQRDVPSRLFAEHLKGLPIRWFILMPVEHRSTLAGLAELEVEDCCGMIGDFADTAALMQQMDLVVSVCTATANLSAALGIDTRVILQRHADWRWQDTKPWYPTVTTYRQVCWGDWSTPLQRLRHDLALQTECSSG